MMPEASPQGSVLPGGTRPGAGATPIGTASESRAGWNR
ncbi:hypothetical protein QFZ79_001074 [Arthrobacter sp. V4I6]|nr:hypothetical protein [Arthrobacter sp. V1I7]MDQ0852963.1 hypothetical protein [Arthrobacter sp. V4I6]